jgi:EAL domain-containing protein (putative c-di-GMP-specific phosphodiesterase class I)
MVAELGCQLGLQVIAEGVETQKQVDLLKELPCHAAQGFFYHRPMRPELVAALFDTSPLTTKA